MKRFKIIAMLLALPLACNAGHLAGEITKVSGTAPTPTPAPTPDGSYTVVQLTADLQSSLQNRQPKYSNRPLGNAANVAQWTPAMVTSLYNGILAAHTFFPELTLTDLAHAMVAEGAVESTGDITLVNASNPQYPSYGYIQGTPATCGLDYTNHGTAFAGLLNPAVTLDYNDPGQNVALWAWYGYNAVEAGESANEAAYNLHNGSVTKIFGNVAMDWNLGPKFDINNATQFAGYLDYWQRMEDYFVLSGFGDADKFNAIMHTPCCSAGLKDFH